MAGVPVINHAHALDFISLNPIIRWYQFSLNWVTSRFFCSKVIAVSCAVKREIIKQGVAVNRISVIYNGINLGDIKYDVNTDKFYNEFNLKPNTRIIGQVGRFHEAKGQHILIKAAKDILNRFPDTIFMFVGEGLGQDNEYAQQLEKLVSDLNLKQRIIFTGYRSDVLELINMFDLFVFPSFFFEGLPLAILEAMAAKKPVITTLIGGNPEIVIDGKTGTIVPPLDPAKLADAIIYHLENPEISQKMGQAGFERVKQYFSLSNMLDEIFSVYVFKS
jgi:glycosyltransferase involved in cell wall biosynthesis